jgi:hypothetical protein
MRMLLINFRRDGTETIQFLTGAVWASEIGGAFVRSRKHDITKTEKGKKG